ncbi:unnamed protein product [Diatraea saccharalis]|uniref:FLYWCH-type domain-containing protein n=1 Tax=Diatraea saccharalis TaxID=40085 RepID=A0A9N9R114_9NEOP|nr:unnamed protein product [Diatraea saccharalis]
MVKEKRSRNGKIRFSTIRDPPLYSRQADIVSIRYEFTESLRGARIILIEGYRFAIKNMSKANAPIKKIQWNCTTHGKHGCKASIFTSRDEIIYLDNKHTHPPQTDKKSQNKYFLPVSKTLFSMLSGGRRAGGSPDGIRYEFTESLRGARIILIEGYRFAIKNMSKVNAPIKKIQWTCSTHGKHGCKAVVFTSRDEIIFLDNKHTHPPQTDKKSQNKYFLPVSKVKMFYRQPDYK